MNRHPNLNQVSPYDEDDHLFLYSLYTGQSPVAIINIILMYRKIYSKTHMKVIILVLTSQTVQ